MSQYAHLSQPDPEWLTAAPPVPQRELPTDFPRYRNEVAQGIKQLCAKQPSRYHSNGPDRDRKRTACRWRNDLYRTYSPDLRLAMGEDEMHRYPILVYLYGGGWCSGTLDSDDSLLRSLTVDLRIVCMAADYRKAPEHPFPTPLDDAYAALKWVVDNAEVLLGDIRKGLIVGGCSAGGNLAAAMAQRAMKDPDLKGKITGQLLVEPALIAASAYPDKFKDELLSLEHNATADVLSAKLLRLFWGKNTMGHASNPEVSPALAPSFDGLPPAYIQIAGMDPLRDEAFLYARLLREAGIATKIDVYPGFPHAFQLFSPALLASRRQNSQLREGIEWLLRSGRTQIAPTS
ncbi:alpha/beta hydrolase fold-domain-containing protein [Hysterangium stoloniferum]|nr:alpha/beta hydrolase fold-domain-containing protein [Hysterangium stoloniferum]